MANKLTEKTLIPISMIIVLIPAVLWFSDVAAKTEETRTRVGKIEEQEQVLIDIQLQLARIEERVNVIYQGLPRRRTSQP